MQTLSIHCILKFFDLFFFSQTLHVPLKISIGGRRGGNSPYLKLTDAVQSFGKFTEDRGGKIAFPNRLNMISLAGILLGTTSKGMVNSLSWGVGEFRNFGKIETKDRVHWRFCFKMYSEMSDTMQNVKMTHFHVQCWSKVSHI